MDKRTHSQRAPTVDAQQLTTARVERERAAVGHGSALPGKLLTHVSAGAQSKSSALQVRMACADLDAAGAPVERARKPRTCRVGRDASTA